MSAIRPLDTRPERSVRSTLHRAGYRFRANVHALPGRPDVVFTRRKVVVFVHGCFWHAHSACGRDKLPKTRTAYWREKLEANRTRDKANLERLAQQGWRAFVIWECETPDEWMGPLVKMLGAP